MPILEWASILRSWRSWQSSERTSPSFWKHYALSEVFLTGGFLLPGCPNTKIELDPMLRAVVKN